MSFTEKVFERQLERTLKDVIDNANQRLTEPEKSRLLVLIAKKMMVDPGRLVTASLDWRTDSIPAKITIEVSDKLYNELKIASEKDGKTIEEFIPWVLFEIDVADME